MTRPGVLICHFLDAVVGGGGITEHCDLLPQSTGFSRSLTIRPTKHLLPCHWLPCSVPSSFCYDAILVETNRRPIPTTSQLYDAVVVNDRANFYIPFESLVITVYNERHQEEKKNKI
jgi:hypothetical protein